MAQALQCPKRQQKCEVRCKALAELKVKPRPEVKCELDHGRNIEFPFELELEVEKRCRIKHIRTLHSKDGCKVKILFKGELDVDCKAKVNHGHCGDHTRLAKVFVKVPTSVEAKVLKVCNGQDEDSSSHRHQPGPFKGQQA